MMLSSHSSILLAEENSVPSLEIKIEATGLENSVIEVPYAGSSISREELTRAPGREVIDRISYTPGVFIQRTAASQASPFVRGLTGEQTLMLLNGVRFSHAMMRPGPNQYSALITNESIDRINTILGPSSSITGSDSLTGTIDFRLANAGRDVETTFSPWAAGRASSGHGGTAELGFDGVHKGWSYSLEGSIARYGDLQGGKDANERLTQTQNNSAFPQQGNNTNLIPNAGYHREAISGRLAYTSGQHEVQLAAGFNGYSDAPRADGYTANSGSSSRISRFFAAQDFSYTHLRYQKTDAKGRAALTATAYLHSHHEEQWRERIRNSGDPDVHYRNELKEDSIDQLGFDISAANDLGANHRITYGLNFSTEKSSNTYTRWTTPDGDVDPANAVISNTSGANTTIPDGATYDRLDLFAQDDWWAGDQHQIIIGLRFSQVSWAADVSGRGYTVDSIDDGTSAFTGQIRYAFHRPESVSWVALGRGFRAPNLTNLTGRQDAGSSSIFVAGNPELDPEYSTGLDVGHRVNNNAFGYATTAFYTQLEDIIQRVYADLDNDGNLDGYTDNGEKGVLMGGELSGWKTFADQGDRFWRISADASLSYGKADAPQADGSIEEDYISRANRIFGNVVAHRQHSQKQGYGIRVRWHTDYHLTAAGDANDRRLTEAGEADGSVPGYHIWDLYAEFTPHAGQRYAITLENIGDTTYREIGSSIDGAGLQLVLDAQARF